MFAALALLGAVAAALAAFVAWPHLQRPRPLPREVAATAGSARNGQPATPPTPREVRIAKPPRAGAEQREPALTRPEPKRPDTEQPAPKQPETEPPAPTRPTGGGGDRSQAGTTVRPPDPPAEAPDPAGPAAAEVGRRLEAVATALRGHDHRAADAALAAATAAAGEHADLSTRVERWRLLAGYARDLDGLVAQALASANEGREYTIGDRTISIIEIGPKTFAYKEAGQIRRGPRASLPRPLERAILKAWFDADGRAANDIFVGVHRLLDASPDLARVRQDWQRAAEGEPAAKSVLPLLDDPGIGGGR